MNKILFLCLEHNSSNLLKFDKFSDFYIGV